MSPLENRDFEAKLAEQQACNEVTAHGPSPSRGLAQVWPLSPDVFFVAPTLVVVLG